MTLTTPVKCAWLLLVLCAVATIALVGKDARAGTPPPRPGSTGPRLRTTRLPNGEPGLVDAGGYAVPLRKYQRIGAGTTIADDLLLALAEPERIAMLTRFGREHKAHSHLYGARAEFGGPSSLEELRAQGIDLLILNHLGAPAELARARELGVEVFNLGEMRGLPTLLTNIAQVAALVGSPERGERLSAQLLRRMHGVAADIAPAARKRAVYVSAYGGQLFGGTVPSSYHDVLTAAGLVDVAAARFRDYPHYDPEQLLDLDPDVIVTQPASVELLCRVSGLARLRACMDGGAGVIGLDDALLGDPGLGMLDAAEALRDRAYGAAAAWRPPVEPQK
ncbi:MAG TPA: ABC transporter substrate-binding protein [Polyangiales bacterium]